LQTIQAFHYLNLRMAAD